MSETSPPGCSNHARLLLLNVFQLRWKGSRRRADLAFQAIERADPDVVVLNEVFNRPARRLVSRLRAGGYDATGEVGGFGGGWTSVSGRRRGVRRFFSGGVCVLSRLPVEERHQHVYRAVAHRTTEVLSNKGAALVSLRLPGGRLWVVGTHLHADERGSRHAERMAQLGELRDFVARVVPAGDPVVLAGDLNVEYYLADAEGRPGPPGPDPGDAGRVLGAPVVTTVHDYTFDAVTNPVTREHYPHTRNVLDYVCALQGAVTVDEVRTLSYPPGEEASDHFPVLARVGVVLPPR